MLCKFCQNGHCLNRRYVHIMLDVVERAYMISKNKGIFFDQEALVEANRYVAALYTAIVYNQPKCVELMLGRLSLREPAYRHSFYTADGSTLEPHLTASDLARSLGKQMHNQYKDRFFEYC